MAGETDLRRLLAGLDPLLHEEEYVFVTLRDRETPAGVRPIFVFEEAEGRTLVLPRAQAEEAGLDGVFSSAWITLRIHSSLEAVGMMAAVSGALAEAGIGCNAVSAFYHDHLFVPWDRAQDAIAVLRALAG
ncbi:ACT domain-containing protein [Actinoallomurus spadix]|uniref:ACT domain-containing protein n=1 Tax=Actinoallomurus spadix TaxID=79912 RepID=UPI0020924815|nr:ACT domain-containing protein [Actinoallomurus spadix]